MYIKYIDTLCRQITLLGRCKFSYDTTPLLSQSILSSLQLCFINFYLIGAAKFALKVCGKSVPTAGIHGSNCNYGTYLYTYNYNFKDTIKVSRLEF